MDAISRDDALAMIAAFIDQQLASGKSGERLIAVNLFERRITSVKASEEPPRLKRLAPISENRLDDGAPSRIK